MTIQHESALPSLFSFWAGSTSLSIVICSCRGSCACSMSPPIVMKTKVFFFSLRDLQSGLSPRRMRKSKKAMNLTCITALSATATDDSTATDLHLDISRLACYETLPQSRFQTRSNVVSQTLLIFVRYYAAATGSRLGALVSKIPSCQSRSHATSPYFYLHHHIRRARCQYTT